jgi:nucleotide-binding universal stress UspA family protein
MFKKILVAVDGSSDADRAVRAASELAEAHGSELHVCHVFHIPDHYRADLADPQEDAIRQDAEDILEHACSVARREGIDATGHLLTEGHPSEAILDLAEELGAGLVVVGERGRSTDERRALGSVSAAVTQSARCSVLLVRRFVTDPS